MSMDKSIHGDDSDGSMPVALPGFERIHRFWDSQNNIYSVKIKPGEYYVTNHGEMISTVLGSCVSACVRDKVKHIGGMNHFMLPISDKYSANEWKDTPVSFATRYGNVAMERLINAILACGASRRNLEIKLFGGGKVLDIDTNIGQMNIDFVQSFLHKEGHAIAASDVGGIWPRKINYYPTSGRVRVKRFYKSHNNTLIKREQMYIEELRSKPVSGEVDLF